MSFTEKRLCNPTQLTTSGQTLYTVPASKTAIIKQIVVTNVTGSAVTFSLFIGSAATPNALFSGTSVAANDTVIINLSQVLSQNEILTSLASANSSLNITISGVENDGPLNPLSTYIADGAITSAKIADGAILNADINASAAIDKTKISGTAITAADTGTVTSTMILDGTIATADIANNAITQPKLASNLSGVTVVTSGTRSSLIPSPFEGQMAYETDTDLLLIWNGSSWKALMQTTSAGSVLQVVLNQPAFGDQAINTGTETSYINPLATITPKQSTSKILIFFTFGAYPNQFNDYWSLYIRRGAVGAANKIASNGGGWQGDWTHNFQMHTTASFGALAHQQYSIHAWDNAGTTNTINYILSGRRESGGTSNFILWSGAINRVTLIEIAQ